MNKKVQFSLPERLIEELNRKSVKTGLNKSALVILALNEYLKEEKEEKSAEKDAEK